MKSPSTIYLITRTHGRRIHLLTPENVKAMSKSRSLPDIVDHLLRSDYAPEIGKLPTGEINSVRLERIFLKILVERFFTIVKDSNGKAQEFLETYAARIEVENLKRILRAKHAQKEIQEHNLIPLEREQTLVNFPALIKAGNVEEAVSLLRETAYASLSDRLDAYRRFGAPLVFESSLDGIYFDRVWEKMGGLPDYEGLKFLVGEEVDLRNLQWIFALKMRDVALRLIEEIPTRISYRLSRNTVSRLLQAGLEDAPGILAGTSYDDVADEIFRKSKDPASDLETILARRLYKNASFALGNLFLEFGYVVAYLLLCEREARNLVTLATASDLKISDENLQRKIF
jgi:vacuolar-type H+-ATPase subunit C/Vma6